MKHVKRTVTSFVVTFAMLPACAETTPPTHNPPAPENTTPPPIASVDPPPVASASTTATATPPTKKYGAAKPGDKVDQRDDGTCWATHYPDLSGFKCPPDATCNPPPPHRYQVDCP